MNIRDNQKVQKVYSSKFFSPLHGYPTKIRRFLLLKKYRWKYGEAAPNPNETFLLNPEKLQHHVSLIHLPDSRPEFGVLDGNWHKEKVYWNDCHWKGLKERFSEGKEWEETAYYQIGIERIESGKGFRPLDGDQTKENFMNYLEYLDQLYQDIKTDGYDNSKPLTVVIGSEGEYISKHGNHRRMISIILDIDEIPIKIKYRHKKWQKKRVKAVKSPNKLTCEEKEHPDIKSLLKK